MSIVRIVVTGAGLIGLRHIVEIRGNLRFDNGALGVFLLSDIAATRKSREQPSQQNKASAAYDDEDAYTIIDAMRWSLRC